MREILFKAKKIDNGEWVEGSYAYVEHIGEHLILDSEKIDMGFDICFTTTQYRIDENTLCQYTGLTDKNGNKIWENDIVNCGGYLVVTWKEEFASFCLSKKGWMYQHFFGEAVNGCDCEVIGNTFDNADLLKGE